MDMIKKRNEFLDDGIRMAFKHIFKKDIETSHKPFLFHYIQDAWPYKKEYFCYRGRVFFEITESFSTEYDKSYITIDSYIPEKKYVHKIDGRVVFTDSYRLKKD